VGCKARAHARGERRAAAAAAARRATHHFARLALKKRVGDERARRRQVARRRRQQRLGHARRRLGQALAADVLAEALEDGLARRLQALRIRLARGSHDGGGRLLALWHRRRAAHCGVDEYNNKYFEVRARSWSRAERARTTTETWRSAGGAREHTARARGARAGE